MTWQTLQPREARWRGLGQRPAIAWFTGLSGAGKSSIANAVDRALTEAGRHAMVLDGDNLRHGLNRDLGFTASDRVENIRRAAETAGLMAEAGLVVIVSLISPFRGASARRRVRSRATSRSWKSSSTLPLPYAGRATRRASPTGRGRGRSRTSPGSPLPTRRRCSPDMTSATDGLSVAGSAAALIVELMRLAAA